jgi:adenosylmethionine-8-amino-7-oxononanoate aminotransferase
VEFVHQGPTDCKGLLGVDISTDEGFQRAKEKGLIIKLMGPALEFAPSLIIKKEEIDWAVKILDHVITEEEKAMGL